MDTKQKNILDGVIDLHVHTAPDVIHRTYNDLELTDAAVRAGARAIVIKGHHCGTVSRAALCNAYNRAVHGDNSFYMYGGLVLNQEAGGLNEQAVQTALGREDHLAADRGRRERISQARKNGWHPHDGQPR